MGYGPYKLKVMKQKGQELRGLGDDLGDKQKVKSKRSGFKTQHPHESLALQSKHECGKVLAGVGRGERILRAPYQAA